MVDLIDFDRFQSTGIGNTNPANLNNLVEREESRCELVFVKMLNGVKTLMKVKCQFTCSLLFTS